MPTPTPAPLDPDALRRALAPFGEGWMLPVAAYTGPQVLEWEQRHLFQASWTCVGRAEELAEPGTQRAVPLGDTSVLLTRGEDGELRAFTNACRHRAHELLPCAGPVQRRHSIVCPYHGWSYRLSGALRNAPGLPPAADPGALGLKRLAAGEWHGWIFVNVTGDAPPLGEAMSTIDAEIARYAPARLATAARHEYTVQANWKVLAENYSECYHCGLIHPELCRISPPGSGDWYEGNGRHNWVGGWMELRDGMRTMSLDGSSPAPPLPGVTGDWLGRVGYIALLPNLLLSLHPDYVMTHRLTPLGVGTTHVECSWLFAPETLATPGFDPSYAVDFWDLTNRQDWAACESVQRGLTSPGYQPGPLCAAEADVHRLVNLLARRYAAGG